jgi:hypothetical protein
MPTSFFLRALPFIFTAALVASPESVSQTADTTAIRFGFGAGWLRSSHQANFDTIPGVASCCRQSYGGADAQGFAASVMGEYPLARFDANAVVSLGAKVLYARGLGANLSALERVQIQGGAALIRHELETALSTFAIEPSFVARLFKRFALGVGARASFFTQADYQYRERIVEPDDIVYSNGQTVFNGASGTIPGVNAAQFHLVGSASYEFPANRAGTILPTLEASYAFPLSAVVGGVDWQFALLKLGVGLRFSPYRTTEQTAQEIEEMFRDSLRQAQETVQKALAEASEAKKKQLSATISSLRPVFFDDDESEEHPLEQTEKADTSSPLSLSSSSPPVIRIQKLQTRESFSLLPTIFFDEQSAITPSRYTMFSSRSHAFSMPPSEWFGAAKSLSVEESRALGEKILYHILNIVGQRMANFPGASLIAHGFALDSETDAPSLAKRRAKAIAAYLENIWGVQAHRIRIETSVVPAMDALPEKRGDGRKVTLASDSPEIFAPALLENEKIAVSPHALALGLQINAGQGLKQWNLECSQLQGREIQTLHAASGGANYPQEYLWDMRARAPQALEPVSANLSIDDVNNNKFEAPIVAIPVRESAGAPSELCLWTITPADTAHLQSALLSVKESLKESAQKSAKDFAEQTRATKPRLRVSARETERNFIQTAVQSILGEGFPVLWNFRPAGNDKRERRYARYPENAVLERFIRIRWR